MTASEVRTAVTTTNCPAPADSSLAVDSDSDSKKMIAFPEI